MRTLMMLKQCQFRMFAVTLLSLLGVVLSADQEYKAGSIPLKPVHLTKDNFRTAIEDPITPFWLLKFYAPWCGHCKKLAPTLDKLADRLAGHMAIGKIDCTTADKKLCDEFGVRGYPTLKFSLDGQVHEYPGGREESDFLAFAKKMSGPAVKAVSTMEDVNRHVNKESEDGVGFVAYHPSVSGDTIEEKLQTGGTLTQVYSQVARQEKASGTFLLLESAEENPGASLGITNPGPFLCRVEENVAPRCFDNVDSVSLDGLSGFVRAQNVPTVSKLGPRNFHKIGRSGRPLVIGVVDEENKEQVSQMKRVLSDFATQGPPAVREKYYYGWFNGKKWSRFLEQFDVVPSEMPQIFILDVPSKTYWQNATYELDLATFLKDVESGTLSSKYGGKKGIEGFVQRFFGLVLAYQPWSVVVIVLLIVSVVVLIASYIAPGEELRPPYPREPDAAPKPSDEGSSEQAEEKDDETKKDK